MKNTIKYLDGKKTFLSSILGTLIGLAYLFDYLTTDQFNALIIIAGSFGLFGLRDAMRKMHDGKRNN